MTPQIASAIAAIIYCALGFIIFSAGWSRGYRRGSDDTYTELQEIRLRAETQRNIREKMGRSAESMAQAESSIRDLH